MKNFACLTHPNDLIFCLELSPFMTHFLLMWMVPHAYPKGFHFQKSCISCSVGCRLTHAYQTSQDRISRIYIIIFNEMAKNIVTSPVNWIPFLGDQTALLAGKPCSLKQTLMLCNTLGSPRLWRSVHLMDTQPSKSQGSNLPQPNRSGREIKKQISICKQVLFMYLLQILNAPHHKIIIFSS